MIVCNVSNIIRFESIRFKDNFRMRTREAMNGQHVLVIRRINKKQGAFIVSFYVLWHHCPTQCSWHLFCRFSMSPPDRHRNFGRSIYTHASGPRDHRWVSWLLAPPSSIIDARSDWETAPLRQGGIHATFLRISCRNMEHTRHMGWMLLLWACAIIVLCFVLTSSAMWEKECITYLC